MEIRITWEVEDGYAGKSRPQHTVFNTEDYMDEEDWNALDEYEKQELIQEAVQEDFDNNVSFYIEDYGI